MDEKNLQKLKSIFRAVLELSESSEVENVSKVTMRKWDSLAQVGMIAAIESEFGVIIRTADYERMSSFKSIVLLLNEYGL